MHRASVSRYSRNEPGKGSAPIFTNDGPTYWSEVRYPLRPNARERILAAIAHLLTLFSLPGMLLASVIWFTQRRRSRYVAMQARQAVLWQTFGIPLSFWLSACSLLTTILSIGGSESKGVPGQIAGGSMVGSVIGLFLIPVGATVFFFASSIVGAIASLLGEKVYYPFIGRLAHRSVKSAADQRRLPPPAKNARQTRTIAPYPSHRDIM